MVIFCCKSPSEPPSVQKSTRVIIGQIYYRRLTIKCQALQRKKSKKYAALDKQHSDADKRQRGRRREQDNKAQHRPRLKIVASECFGLSRVRCAGWNGMDLLVQAQERV